MAFKILLALISVLAYAQAIAYNNYKVYSIKPTSDTQVQILNKLQESGYETWNAAYQIGSNVRVMVAPEQNEEFVKYISSVGINATMTVTNVQELIDAQIKPAPSTERGTMGSFSWTRYHTLEEIESWLDELQVQYPNIVTVVNIGNSVEGRPIKGVVIDYQSGRRDEPLHGFLEGGLHAREWISPASVTWVIKEFLTSTDPDVRFLAEAIVWHIFPVLNPDGFVYTFTDDRMWRKNRNPANFVSCNSTGVRDDLSNGIDLNRNFDYLWMTIGASANPCTQTYAGPTPASEPETQAIVRYIEQVQRNGKLMYYLAYHSFSQMVLIPHSHLTGAAVFETPNFEDLYNITSRGVEKLTAVHGTPYTYGVSAEILYPVAGSGFDWAKGAAEIPLVLLFELRDLGEYGFLLPADQIVPNNEEMMAFVIEMDKAARDLGYYSGDASSIVAGVLSVLSAVVLILSQ